MTSEQAIQVLKEQMIELTSINDKTYQTWKVQTVSIIKEIFTVLSEEYSFINGFSFTSFYSKDSINLQIIKTRPTVTDFLERCIKTIERRKPVKQPEPVVKYIEKPVYKEVEVIKEVMVYPPKVNYFKRFFSWLWRQDTFGLISTVFLIFGLLFGIGWYFGERKADIKNIDLRRDNTELIKDTTAAGKENRKLLDSIHALSLQKSKTITDTQADTNKQKENPDTTHK